MNIGFHYYITKTIAKLAGFSQYYAQIIAYACQYVDQQYQYKPMTIYDLPRLNFPQRVQGRNFDPVCTSHKGIDNILYHFQDIRNKVLAPFHFPPEGNDQTGTLQWQTKRNSAFAREMIIQTFNYLNSAETQQEAEYALIKLGIALHTFQDSFAHQGFSAQNNEEHNGILFGVPFVNGKFKIIPPVTKLLGTSGYNIGHGQLYTFPDTFNTILAYLSSYNKNAKFSHNNSKFCQGAQAVFYLLKGFVKGAQEIWNQNATKILNVLSYQPNNSNLYYKQFHKEFPGYHYYYDSNLWKRMAIKEHMPGIYFYNGDTKWFMFNKAAYQQRMAMQSWIQEGAI